MPLFNVKNQLKSHLFCVIHRKEMICAEKAFKQHYIDKDLQVCNEIIAKLS